MNTSAFRRAPDISFIPKERLRHFFANGTRLAWVSDPDAERVEIRHSLVQRRLLGPGADLDGEDPLPGFRYPIADLSKAWDWENE